jgi:polar amino acid transport system substrate-binding protein
VKKLIMLMGVLGVVTMMLLGCQGGASQQTVKSESVLDRVQSTGVLRVGYFLFEPTMMHEEGTNKPHGLFVDIVEKIAKDLKWEVEYRQVDLKNFGAALQTGDFDLSIGATFSSPGRASGVAFTDPLFYLGYTGITLSENVDKYKTWEDVDQPGVRVAVKQGSAIGDFVRRNFTKAKIIALEEPSLSAALAAVPAQADVGLMNQITVFSYLRDNPQADLKEILADSPVEFTGVCWAVRQGDPVWLNFINTSILHFEDTGMMREWEQKYTIPYLYHEKKKYQYHTSEGSGEIVR